MKERETVNSHIKFLLNVRMLKNEKGLCIFYVAFNEIFRKWVLRKPKKCGYGVAAVVDDEFSLK